MVIKRLLSWPAYLPGQYLRSPPAEPAATNSAGAELNLAGALPAFP